jgi:putative membrane protein
MPLRKHINALKDTESTRVFAFKALLLTRIWKHLLYIGVYTAILCELQLELGFINFPFGVNISGLMTAAIGIYLVFRNRTAYDRWWEGRIIWGRLVNTSRNFALQINSLLPDTQNNVKEEFAELISSFPYALKEHLRDGVKMEEIHFLREENFEYIKSKDHKPNAIVNLMEKKLKLLYDNGSVTDYQLQTLLESPIKLIDIMGMCERIRSTPIPVSHNFLLKSFLFLYYLLLPPGLVGSLGWWTVPVSIMVAYLLNSMVLIDEDIEEPFGTDANDLPLENISNNISKNVGEILLKDRK